MRALRTGPHALPPRPEESPQDAAARVAAAAQQRPSAVPVRHLPPRPPLPGDDEQGASGSEDDDTVAPSIDDEALAPAAESEPEPELVDVELEPEPEPEPELVDVERDSAAEPEPVDVSPELDGSAATGPTAPEEERSTAADAEAEDFAATVSDLLAARDADLSHDPDAEAVEALAHVFDDSLEEAPDEGIPALRLRGVSKTYGRSRAVDAIDLTVPAGTFYGIVGPNGAGKTTTLSMITGLLRPDAGSIEVAGVDARSEPLAAKRLMGVLPDRLRTFDRLTGRQLLYYYGTLRGLSSSVVESRTADLARAFDLTGALGRVVSDYSAGMTKKVMLAGAMIHAPRVLVLDEPFEAVDPVSSSVILEILRTYVAHGGTVVLSSHGMDLVENICSRVAVIVAGQVLAEGTVERVRGELTLEQRFVELAGGLSDVEGLEWLHTYSD